MFLQTNQYNRRQFLERSVLGADSILFSSMLLERCTDYIIPPLPLDRSFIRRLEAYQTEAPI